ncbi:MAG: hypothetical protein JST70_14020 [Bacteroidetes bacterium]|nr:hypothetical protein [Bacteroidota bacterium]
MKALTDRRELRPKRFDEINVKCFCVNPSIDFIISSIIFYQLYCCVENNYMIPMPQPTSRQDYQTALQLMNQAFNELGLHPSFNIKDIGILNEN